jgi:hypothetical protein
MSCEGVCQQGRKPCPTPGACRQVGSSEVLLFVVTFCLLCLALLGLLMWLP